MDSFEAPCMTSYCVKQQIPFVRIIQNTIQFKALTEFLSSSSKLLLQKNMSNKMQHYTVCFIWKLLHMFRVVPPPIIRSANNCIYSIWYLSHSYCCLPLSWESWNWCWVCCGWRTRQVVVTVWQIPDAVDTVVCAPDDGWWYRPKHVEQFPDKINCVTLHLVGHILEYSYDARIHER